MRNIGNITFIPIFFRFLNEPLPEQRFGHAFQCGILAMQQVYFVVQTTEDGSNGFLLSKWGEKYF